MHLTWLHFSWLAMPARNFSGVKLDPCLCFSQRNIRRRENFRYVEPTDSLSFCSGSNQTLWTTWNRDCSSSFSKAVVWSIRLQDGNQCCWGSGNLEGKGSNGSLKVTLFQMPFPFSAYFRLSWRHLSPCHIWLICINILEVILEQYCIWTN